MRPTLQQGFPPAEVIENCLPSHSNMLGRSQSARLMGISCKCSACVCVCVCILWCILKNTGVPRRDVRVIRQTLYTCTIVRLNLDSPSVRLLVCTVFTLRCEDGNNSYGTFGMWDNMWHRCWRSPFKHEQKRLLQCEYRLFFFLRMCFSVTHRNKSIFRDLLFCCPSVFKALQSVFPSCAHHSTFCLEQKQVRG